MKDFTGWKYYNGMDGQPIGIMFVHPDGKCESSGLSDPEVAEWLAAGNTPLPAEET